MITGADHEAIRAAVPAGVEVARNDAWARGRTGGIQLAVRLRRERDLCLAPVDVPLVPAEVFAALSRAWEEAGAPARGWLAPAVELDGEIRHGHPVVVGRDLLAELAAWPPERPLRELRARAAPLLSAPVGAVEVLDDLDEPADLAALRRRQG